MGRPYAAELSELDVTYEWCMHAPISGLVQSIIKSVSRPFIAVGSGGSLTCAHFASFLHTRLTGQSSQVFTPYELVTTPQQLRGSAVLVCSAGGSNPDVLLAVEFLIKRPPQNLFAVVTSEGSPLQTQFESAGWPACHDFVTPSKKDGFLATNSLLATIVLLARAYESLSDAGSSLPPTLSALLHPGGVRNEFIDQHRKMLLPVLMRETIIVLHGAVTKPAAIDIESRLTEAAFANVQLADFRNFAHGRHLWLARHPGSSAVLALAEDGDDISRRTLSLVPSSIPRCQVSVEPSVRGAIAAVYQSLISAEIAGTAKGYDPGRPNVPEFGRKLYHLKATPRAFPHFEDRRTRMHLAIEQKAGLPVSALWLRNELDAWLEHYRTFIGRLGDARIRAIVLDYDGTLCGARRRFDGPSTEVAGRLISLIEAGVPVAIATGRGKSVREALGRLVTLPGHRERLIVGYHNGAQIATLADLSCPTEHRPLVDELAGVAEALKSSIAVGKNATITAKGKQISLELMPLGDAKVLFDEVTQIVQRAGVSDISLVTSDHSIDIIAPGVSKSNVVVEMIRRLALSDGAKSVLCIGDRGRAPGNDAELLSHPLSLSVDEVSVDPSTCWNIATPGLRFDSACLEYLTRLHIENATMQFETKGMQL